MGERDELQRKLDEHYARMEDLRRVHKEKRVEHDRATAEVDREWSVGLNLRTRLRHLERDNTPSPTPNAQEPYPITATVSDFCRISRLGRSLVYELLAAGELRGIKVGTRRLILLESYLEFIERQKADAE